MAQLTQQDAQGRVRATLNLENKQGWNATTHPTVTVKIDRAGMVPSPYYSDGRMVAGPLTFTTEES